MDEALPRSPLWPIPAPESEIDLVLRQDFSTERLSERELEALCPVLPELIGELLMMSQPPDERE